MNRDTPSRCDLVFRGATIIDGTGAKRFTADVGVEGDRVVAVGDLATTRAQEDVQAKGRVLCPGFIDTHAHDDRAMMMEPDMVAKVSQGVTSVVVGNCGVSLAPLATEEPPPPPLTVLFDKGDFIFPTMQHYLGRLAEKPSAVNAACLVGHSTLRVGAMGDLKKPADTRELETMKDRLREAMRAGAIGFSSGLFYPPSQAATEAETGELARVAGQAGGIYTAHIRDEGVGIMESLAETFRIGACGGLPTVISHHKVAGQNMFGRSHETLAMMDRVRETQEVAFDAYPYVAASSWLTPDYLQFCYRATVTWSTPHPEMAGRDVADIAKEWDCEQKEAMRRMQPGGASYFIMDEADVRRVISHPHAMIGSDGIPDDQHPHPRLWGTFPRMLGHYSRDIGLFPLEDAVRRMTSLPARNFGFAGRGVVKPGAYADLVLFDPNTVIDSATFEHPTRPAAGIEMVLVNGAPVWRNGRATGAHPGRVLKREARAAA